MFPEYTYAKNLNSLNTLNFNIDESIFHSIDYYIKLPKKFKCSSPPPSYISLKNNQRIIAIGDLHGDFYSLLYSLHKSNVIDLNGKWVGKNTLVVQVGDQIDKGGRGVEITDDDVLEELKIMEFLHDLHFKALKSGGGVFNLIGNHEIMNVLGDFNYVSKHHMNGFGGQEIRKKLFEPGGALAQKLACNTNALLKVGDWIFVHAGLLPEHIEKYSIKDINDTVRELLLGNLSFDTINEDIRNIIVGNTGFLWSRKYSNGTDPDRCSELEKVMGILKIGNKGGMVVGHTIKSQISNDCNERLWMVDVGMSPAFRQDNNKRNSRIQVLEIKDNGRIVRSI